MYQLTSPKDAGCDYSCAFGDIPDHFQKASHDLLGLFSQSMGPSFLNDNCYYVHMDLVWFFTVMFTVYTFKHQKLDDLNTGSPQELCTSRGIALPSKNFTLRYDTKLGVVFLVDLECPGWIMSFPSGWMVCFNILVSSLVHLRKC